MVVDNFLTTVLAVGIVVVDVLAERTWTVQGDQRRDVGIEARRCQAPHELAHLVAFELEQPDRIAQLQHGENLRVVQRHVVDVHHDAVSPA